MLKERGEGVDIIIIILGVVALLFVLSFWKSAPAFWDSIHFKQILRVPCGLTVKAPVYDKSDKVVFPIDTEGWVNGCGWELAGTSAGTVQVFDAKGIAVTAPTDMTSDSKYTPYYFSATLKLITAPSTDTGQILFRSTKGLLQPVPVSF